MKKRALLSLLVITLVSCGTAPQGSFTFNGKTYKTGFYKYYGQELHVLGINRRGLRTSDFNSGKYHYWKLNHESYDLYFGVNQEAAVWSPAIYCVSEQLAEANKFYTDLANYNYYIGEYLNEQSFIKIEDETYYEALEYAIKVMITRPFSRRVNQKIDIDEFESMTIFRTSTDGLFTSTRDEFLYKEDVGFIYVASYFDDSKESIYYALTKENNDLLIELHQKLYPEVEVIDEEVIEE